MTLQCVRCHAEDTRPARFCRACGYPYAFDEFMACPVCGGEVRAGTKICPGCHHQFAIPVLARGDEVRPRRRRSYLLSAAVGMVLGGLAFFYVSGSKDFALEPERALATKAQVTETPSPESAASLFTAPSSFGEVLREETTGPPQNESAPPEESQALAPSAPAAEPGKETLSPFPKKDHPPSAKREERKAVEKTLKPEAKTVAVATTPEIKTEPKAIIELAPIETVVEIMPKNPAPPPTQETAVEAKATQEVRNEKAAVAAAERPKVSAAKRGAPVVERSRIAEPGQVSALARKGIRGRDCEGKWEGDCRQFPDHKPNW